MNMQDKFRLQGYNDAKQISILPHSEHIATDLNIDLEAAYRE